MNERKFWFGAHPIQGILEAWALGFLALFLLSRLVGQVPRAVLANGLLALCGVSGMWAVLRIRLPEGRWWRQVLWEIGVGVALSLVMALGTLLPASWLRWEAIWQQAGPFPFSLLLLGIGPGYLFTRFVVRLWRYWNRLRRQRMLWSLTHAHLVVVAIAILLFVLILVVLGPLRTTLPDSIEADTLGERLAERILHTLFPAAMVVLFVSVVAMITVLPLSALFSFLVARRTTRRLEKLTEATGALRSGDYEARVEVEGEDEVAQLQADFNAMAMDLEETLRDLEAERDKVTRLLQSRRQLVVGVSHELRTPVATVRGYLDSLRSNWDEDHPPATLRHDLEIMEQEMTRLQTLIDDLFTLARAEAGGLPLALEPTNVEALIRRRVEAFTPLAWDRHRVEMVVEVPTDLPTAQADSGRLEQILNNLLRNALRHTPPGGIVIATARTEGDNLRLEICDTGEGIPPEELPHVWERFYRGEQARSRDARGAGLGLALVKELTESMGGSVAVESTVGEGSCFSVILPQA